MSKLYIKRDFEGLDYDLYNMIKMFFYEHDIEMIKEGNGHIKLSLKDDIFCVKVEEKEYSYRLINKMDKDEIKRCLFISLEDLTKKIMPWGTLVGIRPSKIAYKLIEKGFCKDSIVRYYKENYLTHEDKAKLCYSVSKKEKDLISKIINKNSYSMYIGMPFCPSRCYYCSFTSNPIDKNLNLVDPYINTLLLEIDEIYEYIKDDFSLSTVYFGGGTPTSIDERQFERVLKRIYDSFVKHNDIFEFTVECGRADTITKEKLRIMSYYGVNRISINPQTMNDETLKKIGRTHTVQDVIDAYNMAVNEGFKNINMDLIVGLKDETSWHMDNTCRSIYNLSPKSITVHGLSVKRSSKLHEDIVLGKESIYHNEILKMYEASYDLCLKLNLKPYYLYRQKNMIGSMENIGYSIEGFESLYNILIMEEKQNILAFGCDGVSKFIFGDEIKRQKNIKDLRGYIKDVNKLIEDKKSYIELVSKG